MKRLLPVILLAVLAVSARAQQQVGYAPSRSPYQDVDQTMEIALLTGHFSAAPDPAGVAPQGGPMWAFLYGWHAAGPLFLNASLSRTSSVRKVLDPSQVNEDLGLWYWPLWAVDGTASLSLTGDKTFHGFMPLANLGMGLISDRHTQSDVGSYQFGTRFEFVWGFTLRWVPTSRWALRADLNNRMYSMGYPQTYYATNKDSTTIVPATLAKSFWRNNPSLTIGISYLFSHH